MREVLCSLLFTVHVAVFRTNKASIFQQNIPTGLVLQWALGFGLRALFLSFGLWALPAAVDCYMTRISLEGSGPVGGGMRSGQD